MGGDSHAYYFHKGENGLRMEATTFSYNQGFQQGNVLGTWAFCMAMQRLLELMDLHMDEFHQLQREEDAIQRQVERNNNQNQNGEQENGDQQEAEPEQHYYDQCFYVDDGNAIGIMHHMMVEFVRYMKRMGPKLGFVVNPDKGAILIGKCTTVEEMEARKQAYINLGISPDIIVCNPGTYEGNQDNNIDPEMLQQMEIKFGAKILGSYIGSEAYIKEQLHNKTESWARLMLQLEAFPESQARLMLLRKCFAPKYVYLLRTIPQYLVVKDFVDKVMVMQKRVLGSILKKMGQTDDHLYMQMCLTFKNGGFLDLLYVEDVAKVANLASLVHNTLGAFDTIRTTITNVTEEKMGETCRTICAQLLAPEFPLPVKQGVNVETIIGVLPRLEYLRELAREQKGADSTLQKMMYLKFQEQRIAVLDSYLDAREGLSEEEKQKRLVRKAKWVGVKKSEVASLFLEANPYHSGFAFYSNDTFTYALRARYGFTHQDVMQANKRCRCQKEPDMCIDDGFGEHFVSGCPFYGCRQYIHDQVKYAVMECAKLAEAPVDMEQTGVLRDANDHRDDGRERPDLIMKLPYPTCPGLKTCVVEVTIGNTLEGTVSGRIKCSPNQLTQGGSIAAKKFREKRNKYNELAVAKGMDLKVISIETNGFIHEESLKFIKSLAFVACERKKDVDYYDLKKFMLTKLSVALYSAIGTVINRRINAANSHCAPTIEEHRRQTGMILQAVAPAQ
jgi:hypothetical protein